MNEDLVEKIDDRIATLKDERARLLAAKVLLRGAAKVLRGPAKTVRSAGRPARPRRRGSGAKEETQRTALLELEDHLSALPPTKPRSAAGAKRTRGKARPRGAAREAIFEALEEVYPEALTASTVAARTGLGPASVSTTLTKLAKAKRIEKADRGYRAGGR